MPNLIDRHQAIVVEVKQFRVVGHVDSTVRDLSPLAPVDPTDGRQAAAWRPGYRSIAFGPFQPGLGALPQTGTLAHP